MGIQWKLGKDTFTAKLYRNLIHLFSVFFWSSCTVKTCT